MATITISNGRVIRGTAALFRSADAARAASAWACTSPGIVAFDTPAGERFAGRGDTLLGADGSREQALYGRGRKALRVVRAQ